MSYRDLTVYVDGAFKKYGDVNIGLMNHSFLYGTACFEAMRAYRSDDTREWRLLAAREHYERLHNSARILRMQLPYTVDELTAATARLLAENDFNTDVYIRATLYKSAEQLGVRLHDVADSIAIVAIPYSGYYGSLKGLSAGVSAWKRVEDNAAPARAKISGIYINSALAKSGAVEAGFDEAITLTEDGHVAEASAANVFLRRGRTIITPSVTDNILEGITRRIVLELLRQDETVAVAERSVDRSELYVADEIFISGTAVGITPVTSVDRRTVGDGEIGPYTSRLQRIFGEDLRSASPVLRSYLTTVAAAAPVG